MKYREYVLVLLLSTGLAAKALGQAPATPSRTPPPPTPDYGDQGGTSISGDASKPEAKKHPKKAAKKRGSAKKTEGKAANSKTADEEKQ